MKFTKTDINSVLLFYLSLTRRLVPACVCVLVHLSHSFFCSILEKWILHDDACTRHDGEAEIPLLK